MKSKYINRIYAWCQRKNDLIKIDGKSNSKLDGNYCLKTVQFLFLFGSHLKEIDIKILVNAVPSKGRVIKHVIQHSNDVYQDLC